MKKNRTMRVAVLMLALTLLTCCFVGSTFAKYTSTTTGSDTVTVAKWQIEVNDTDITATTNNQPTFDLFGDTAQFDELGDDVAAGKVAPGTKGSFNFKVENLADVSVKYTVSFTVTFPDGLDSNRFKFYSDSAMNQEITATSGVYTVANAVEVEVGTTAPQTIDVYWQWTFAEDAVDNALSNTTITVTPTIVVEQVD